MQHHKLAQPRLQGLRIEEGLLFKLHYSDRKKRHKSRIPSTYVAMPKPEVTQASRVSFADLTSLERGEPEQDLQRRLVGKQCDEPWCCLTGVNEPPVAISLATRTAISRRKSFRTRGKWEECR